MPDATRSRQRPRARAAGRLATPPEAYGTTLPCIVGGLLSGLPELPLLVKAALGVARLQFVDDRLALLSTVAASRPAALVVPPFDADHTSTAPLVLRVRREEPHVGVLVVSSHPRGAGQPMVRAAQAGAFVLTSPTAAELSEALASLIGARPAGD